MNKGELTMKIISWLVISLMCSPYIGILINGVIIVTFWNRYDDESRVIVSFTMVSSVSLTILTTMLWM